MTGACDLLAGGGQININLDSITGVFGNIAATAAAANIPASVGVDVNVLGSGYIADGTTYDIVAGQAAGGLVAGGNTVTDNSSYVSFTTTGGDNLVLVASRSGSGFEDFAKSPNSKEVGKTLEEIGKKGATGDMKTVLDTLEGLPTGDIDGALSTMTPDVSSGAANASRELTGNFLSTVTNRLGVVRGGTGIATGEVMDGVGIWAQGLGSHIKQDERKGIQGYQANIFGTTIGADKLVDEHIRLGLAGGYGFANVNSKQPGSPSDTINSGSAILYGSYDSLDLCEAREKGKNSRAAVRNQGENFWYVDGMAAFTQNSYDSRREIWLGNTKRVAKADHYAQQYTTSFEGGLIYLRDRGSEGS
jgi:outer membrane autotransporter protein